MMGGYVVFLNRVRIISKPGISLILSFILLFFYVSTSFAAQDTQRRAIELTDEAVAMRDIDKKIVLYKQAINIDSSYERAYNNLAFVMYEAGDYSGAVDHFKHALTLNPSNIDNHYNLAESVLKTIKTNKLEIKRLKQALFHLYAYELGISYKQKKRGNAKRLTHNIESVLDSYYSENGNTRYSINDIVIALASVMDDDNTRGESLYAGGRKARSINFRSGSQKISDRGKDRLMDICIALKRIPIRDHDIALIGYTHFKERYEDVLQKLALKRVQAVKAYLIDYCDIKESRIFVQVSDPALNYWPNGSVEFVDKTTGMMITTPNL